MQSLWNISKLYFIASSMRKLVKQFMLFSQWIWFMSYSVILFITHSRFKTEFCEQESEKWENKNLTLKRRTHRKDFHGSSKDASKAEQGEEIKKFNEYGIFWRRVHGKVFNEFLATYTNWVWNHLICLIFFDFTHE